MFIIQELIHKTNVVELFQQSYNVDSLICIRPVNCDWALCKSAGKINEGLVNAIYALSESLEVCLPSYVYYLSEDERSGYLDSFKFDIKDWNGKIRTLCRIAITGEDLLILSQNELQQFCLFNINMIMSK